MNIKAFLLYLIGSRTAILEIAGNRHTLWVGAVFVLSAGLAREYDGEDLLHEPAYLLLPYLASLITSFLLFVMTHRESVGESAPVKSFFQQYRMFLGLFWMTAPLAWLYAIPYERFLT